MYSTCTAIVTMVYADTLTRGVGDRVVVMYVYSTRTAIVTVVYTDTLMRRVGDRVVIRVQYAYCHSYYGIVGWNGSACTLCVWLDVQKAITWTIHVLPEYLWSQCWMTDLTWQCWTWLFE